MNKWILRIIYAALVLAPVAALADYTATQGAGSSVFAFVCSTTKICPAMVLIDSTNTEKATAGNPLRIDPTGTTTQPVSAASLPLPTGAATSANQPTNAAQGSTTSGQTGRLVQCAVTTASPTYTTAQTDPLSCDTAGNVRVNVTNTNANGQATMANSSPVVIASNQSALPTTGAVNVTPTDCSGSITTGATAQNALAAQTTLHGLTIMNIDTTEPLWISFTTTAAASTAASYPLQAATASTFASPGSFTTPNGFATNHALSVIAATTGHKWSCTWW